MRIVKAKMVHPRIYSVVYFFGIWHNKICYGFYGNFPRLKYISRTFDPTSEFFKWNDFGACYPVAKVLTILGWKDVA